MADKYQKFLTSPPIKDKGMQATTNHHFSHTALGSIERCNIRTPKLLKIVSKEKAQAQPF